MLRYAPAVFLAALPIVIVAEACCPAQYVNALNANRCIGDAFLVYANRSGNQRSCATDVSRNAPYADAFTFYWGNNSCFAHFINESAVQNIGVSDPKALVCRFYQKVKTASNVTTISTNSNTTGATSEATATTTTTTTAPTATTATSTSTPATTQTRSVSNTKTSTETTKTAATSASASATVDENWTKSTDNFLFKCDLLSITNTQVQCINITETSRNHKMFSGGLGSSGLSPKMNSSTSDASDFVALCNILFLTTGGKNFSYFQLSLASEDKDSDRFFRKQGGTWDLKKKNEYSPNITCFY